MWVTCPRDAPELPSTANDRHQQQPVNLKLAWALNPATNARDTLVMRSSRVPVPDGAANHRQPANVAPSRKLPGFQLTRGHVCRAKTRTLALSWCFLRWLGCSPVFADQALDGLSALDPGGHIDGGLVGLVQRRSLLPRLVGPVIVVMLRVLGQDPPKVLFAVDQQVVEALAA